MRLFHRTSGNPDHAVKYLLSGIPDCSNLEELNNPVGSAAEEIVENFYTFSYVLGTISPLKNADELNVDVANSGGELAAPATEMPTNEQHQLVIII